MIYRALTTRISLGPERSIPGLHQCRNIVSEMEFLFPFPEDIHPTLLEPRSGKLVIKRAALSRDLSIWSLSVKGTSTLRIGRATCFRHISLTKSPCTLALTMIRKSSSIRSPGESTHDRFGSRL